MLLREYETIYILRPDMPEDGMIQVNERLSGILDREGAKILKHDVWGKKKLAFEVKKHPKGVYVYLNYLGKPEAIREIERNLRLIEPVLSYQTVKIAENVDVEHRVAEQDAENQAQAAAEAQRKAETEARRLAEDEGQERQEGQEETAARISPEKGLPVLRRQESQSGLSRSQLSEVLHHRERQDHPATDIWQLCSAPASGFQGNQERPADSPLALQLVEHLTNCLECAQ